MAKRAIFESKLTLKSAKAGVAQFKMDPGLLNVSMVEIAGLLPGDFEPTTHEVTGKLKVFVSVKKK